MHTTALITVITASSLAAAFNPAHLFPIAVQNAWTTLPSAPTGSGATVVALDDDVLGVRKKMSGVEYSVVNAPGDAPAGAQAWPAVFPAGSYNPSGTPRGGVGFYFPGPEGHWWNDTSVTQILFSYAVYLPNGFNPVQGGKLPGPYGGSSEDVAYACSGGRQEERQACFDLRLMWRENVAGEIYAYLPQVDANSAAVNQIAGTVIDNDYGISVARGSFSFKTGDYTVVAQRVQLNTVGQSDGELELWVDGKSVIHVAGLQIRTQAESIARGVHFQSFFGGSDATWATPTEQTIHFTGISGGTVQSGASPAQGGAAYPLGQASTHPPRPSDSTTANPSVTRSGGSGNPSSTPDQPDSAMGARAPAIIAIATALFFAFCL